MLPVQGTLGIPQAAATDTADTYDAPVWVSTSALNFIAEQYANTGRQHASSITTALRLVPPVVFSPTFLGSFRASGVQHIIAAKLAVLESLADGWLGPGSVRPAPSALRNYRAFLETLGAATLDAEAVPTGEGTVRVEWETTDGSERVIEFGTDDDAWLYDSGSGENGPAFSVADTDDDTEILVAPFDVNVVVDFFRSAH